MAIGITAREARILFDMGLISDEEYQHYKAVMEWRKTLRAGANTTAEQQQREAFPLGVGGRVAKG